MNKIVLLFLLLLNISFTISSEKRKPSPVLIEIGKDKKVTLQDFEDFYRKYSGNTNVKLALSKEDTERFLDMFVKFHLKLTDAKGRKLDTLSDVQEEARQYRNELAKSYLLEQELTLPAIKKMYQRRKEEIRARHILLKLPEPEETEEDEEDEENSDEEKPQDVDTTETWEKAIDILKKLKAGEKFENLVEEFTEDPAGKNNGGDLYYFTTGQMVTPFEDACYSLKKGEITKEPIHSVFGYHIIQVTDRKKAIGSVRVSHIMARFNSANPAPDDTMQAWKKISAMYDSAKQKRVNFATLAKRHSDDAGSAANGGDVGFFTRRRWVQAFDEAAFQLNVGQLSNIIRTPYGYHILKCTEVKPVASFDSLKEELKSQYLSSRFSDEKATFLESLKKKYGFSEDKTVFLALVNMLDTSKVLAESAWANSFTEEVRAKSLIQFMGKEWSVNSILPLVEQTPENQGTELIEEEFRVALNRVYEDLLLSEEAKTVEKKYPEFEKLMAEFVDGILLYRVEQEEVWAKVSVTDSALESFFNANRERFRFPHRVNTSVIHVGTDTLANEAYQKLQRGIPFDSVALMSNASILMRLRKGNMDWLNADQDTMTRLAWTMEKGTYSAPFLFEGKGWTLVYVNDKDSTRRKTFDEAGSEISNAYQDAEAKKFELQWLEGVKQRFAVTVHREVVEKAFAKKK